MFEWVHVGCTCLSSALSVFGCLCNRFNQIFPRRRTPSSQNRLWISSPRAELVWLRSRGCSSASRHQTTAPASEALPITTTAQTPVAADPGTLVQRKRLHLSDGWAIGRHLLHSAQEFVAEREQDCFGKAFAARKPKHQWAAPADPMAAIPTSAAHPTAGVTHWGLHPALNTAVRTVVQGRYKLCHACRTHTAPEAPTWLIYQGCDLWCPCPRGIFLLKWKNFVVSIPFERTATWHLLTAQVSWIPSSCRGHWVTTLFKNAAKDSYEWCSCNTATSKASSLRM